MGTRSNNWAAATVSTRQRIQVAKEIKEIQDSELLEQQARLAAEQLPLKEAEATFQQTLNEFRLELRDIVLSKKVSDYDNIIDHLPTVPDYEAVEADEIKLVEAVCKDFLDQTEAYRRIASPDNYAKLRAFMVRNSLNPTHLNCWQAAFEMLHQFSVFDEPKVEQPKPAPVPTVNLTVDPTEQSLDPAAAYEQYATAPVLTFEGHKYSQKDLDSLSSEEYKRIMRLKKNLSFSDVIAGMR